MADYRPLAPDMSRRVIAVDLRPLDSTGALAQRREAVDSLIPRIAERPEVVHAVPDVTAFAVRGLASVDSIVSIVHMEGTAPGWFATVDVPIVLGRDVSLADTAAADYPVVIPSDVARKLWGNAIPVGRTLASPPLPGLAQDSMAMTVVGVYDASYRLPGMTWNGGTARSNVPARIFTARGKQWRHDRILVQTRGPAAGFVPELRRFVRAKTPSIPMTSMLTLAQADDQDYRTTLKNAALAASGGALALLLASLGLYGVVSLAVRQRTREIGIRIAVGAEPMMVVRMFLKSGVRMSLVALAVGLPLSIAALKVGMAQGAINAPDANPYLIGAVIAVVLLVVASAASWVPARRAAKIDAARTLRVE
jgi:hypothetical protein